MAKSLKGPIQNAIGQSVDLYIGKVASAKPLSITLQGDSNLTISSGLLSVPEHLSKRTVNLKIVINGVNQNTTATIDDSLKVGDEVYILSVGRGSNYLVVGRC